MRQQSVGQKGWRDYWNWQKGNNIGNLAERGKTQKAYTRLASIHMNWPSPVGESYGSQGRQVAPGGALGNWQLVTNLPVAPHLLNGWVGFHRLSSFQLRAAWCQQAAYIWVSFCRTGKMSVSCHIFSKSRAFGDLT